MIKYKTNLNCNLNEFHNWNITGVYINDRSVVVSDSASTPLARIEQFSAFESVQEITGALVVERHSPDFTNLSFFRNLRTIHGRELR